MKLQEFLALFGASLGTVSFFWQVFRTFVADRQELSLAPEGITIGKPAERIGEVFSVSPTQLYVKICNTGRRPVVLDTILVLDAKTGHTIGGQNFREWNDDGHVGHAKAEGLKLDIEDFRVIPVPMVDGNDPFNPSPDSRGQILIHTSRGREFRSKTFKFSEQGDPDIGFPIGISKNSVMEVSRTVSYRPPGQSHRRTEDEVQF
jgi:hypothetical protein